MYRTSVSVPWGDYGTEGVGVRKRLEGEGFGRPVTVRDFLLPFSQKFLQGRVVVGWGRVVTVYFVTVIVKH